MNVLVKRLFVIYGQPDSHDPKAYIEEVTKLTDKYSNAVLSDAADVVISTHRYKTWPTPAQCVSACKQVIEEQADKVPNGRQYHFPSKRGPYDPVTVATWERATAWRASLPDTHPLVRQSMTVAKWLDTSKPAFERMQRESPNQGLHRVRLTERSRRMQGDDA